MANTNMYSPNEQDYTAGLPEKSLLTLWHPP